MLTVLNVYLADNPLNGLRRMAFNGKLPSIQILDIRRCGLSELESDIFQSMPNLKQLNLSGNNFTSFPRTVFQYLLTLSTLDLSGNHLTSVSGLFDRIPNLEDLRLSHNAVESVDYAFSELVKLNTLSLTRNNMTSLTDDSFRGLQNLQVLNLGGNRIASMSNNCFSGLVNLKSITLSSNRITVLNQALNNLPNLQRVELSHNKLTFLNKGDFLGLTNLRIMRLEYNRLTSISDSFHEVVGLVELRLKNNKLTTLSIDVLPSVIKLQHFGMKGNPWSCDCRLSWLLIWMQSTNYSALVDDPTCSSPPWVSGMKFRDLVPADTTHWPAKCPAECTCTCVPRIPGFFVSVNCSNRTLKEAPAPLPDSVGELLLSTNSLTDIGAVNLSVLTTLRVLDLEHNLLKVFDQPLPVSLQVLKLAGNRLRRFPLQVIGSVHLRQVTLSLNPWLCDCTAEPFHRWLLERRDNVTDVDNVTCGPDSQDKTLVNRAIVSLSGSELCPPPLALYIVVCIGLLVCLLCGAAAVIAYNRFQLHLKIWLYSRGFTCIKERDIDNDKLYHAFVSYCSKDEPFVVRHLVPGLESQELFYKLCLHYRDFFPGNYIHDSIVNAVKCSSRTIILLTKNFLDSDWCTLELRTAHTQTLQDKLNRLIIITYGDLPPLSELEPTIKLHLDAAPYLTWGEKYFWKKLRFRMPEITTQKVSRCRQLNASTDDVTSLSTELQDGVHLFRVQDWAPTNGHTC